MSVEVLPKLPDINIKYPAAFRRSGTGSIYLFVAPTRCMKLSNTHGSHETSVGEVTMPCSDKRFWEPVDIAIKHD